MASEDYDPFVIGPHPIGSRTWQARDEARDRLFTSEIWYPAEADQEGAAGPGGRSASTPSTPSTPGEADENGELRDATPLRGPHPLVVFSHFSGGGRRMSSFLGRHLASHGYAVAAMDHSEVTAPELATQPGETPEQRAARVEAIMASRVPDVRFLLAHLTAGKPPSPSHAEAGPGGAGDIELDVDQLGLVGHSFGGWTALATPDVERRVRAVVALAPGGSSKPRPGILPLSLDFAWGGTFPRCISLPTVTWAFRRTAWPSSMTGLRPPSGCSSCGGPTTSTSSTTWRSCTNSCDR
jgi:dienelactone hydrolase